MQLYPTALRKVNRFVGFKIVTALAVQTTSREYFLSAHLKKVKFGITSNAHISI
jgi:hypothetical protein